MDKLYTFRFSGTDIDTIAIHACSIEDAVIRFKNLFGISFYNSVEPLINDIKIYD